MEFSINHIAELIAFVSLIVIIIISLLKYFRYKIKNKKENEELSKADIEANSNYNGKGKNTIYIYNKGKSEARNVNVIIPDEEDIFVIKKDKLFPTNILPQNSVKFIIEASMNAPDKIDIIFKWEDNFKKDNNKSQLIQLNI